MQSFVRRILVQRNTYEFSFERLLTMGEERYYVKVVDGKGKLHLFQMQKRGSRWKIIDAPKVAHWILTLEERLAEAILLQDKKGQT